MNWYTISFEETLKKLDSTLNGLNQQEVLLRQKRFGLNLLRVEKSTSPWKILFSQFTDFMILILISAAILAGVAGDLTDTIIILIIILVNAIIGFFQEYRADKALAALKQLSAPQAKVLREGVIATFSSEELVPGDIVILEAGQIVPADIRLFEAWSLSVSEAGLTGESISVEKVTEKLEETNLPLGDRKNLVFKSTLVTSGRGKGIVVETGMQTEFGKIAGLLGHKAQSSPLQIRMAAFGKKLTWAILGLCVVLFAIGWLRNEEIINLILTIISMAVAAIPEALPVVITVSLALGARKMIQHQVLVRKLSAIESLGSITCICTDKTGTLTQNKMTAEQYWINPGAEVHQFQYTLCLNHDVVFQDSIQGEPTEMALVELAVRLNYQPKEIFDQFPRIGEIPFDSTRKRMGTLHEIESTPYLLVKGAPESLFPILKLANSEALEKSAEWAAQGFRVLAFAGKPISKEESLKPNVQMEDQLMLYGLVGLLDPPRPEVPNAIKECKQAGIRPIMITGDHPLTALSIAQKVGIISEIKPDECITGTELESLSDETLLPRIEKVKVYARVSPEQKFRLVTLLQTSGEFVAMTGDGVNDAPALEKSHVGVAMGINGTEVTRQAADLVLLDDNFSTIVRAIKHGRTIYNNLRKFIRYALTCNSGELWTLMLAPLLGLPIPLLPIHILWINLVTDGLPGIALSSEPADEDIMQKNPRKPHESIFAEGLGLHVVWVGLLMGIISVATAYWCIQNEIPHWQTMVFTVLCFAQMFHVITIRAERTPFYKIPFFRNPILPGSVALTLILQMVILYTPIFNDWFHTDPLTVNELFTCFGIASIIGIAVELEKWISYLIAKRSKPRP